MLGNYPVIAMIATTQPERAKTFYSEVLGVKLVEDGWFALVFTAGGTRLHIQKVKQFSPLPFTALGWRSLTSGRRWRNWRRRASSSSDTKKCRKMTRVSGRLRMEPKYAGSKTLTATLCR